MGVHLYINGDWVDSGKIYRNSENLFNINLWSNATGQRGNVAVANGAVTITAYQDDAYTKTYGNYSTEYDISVIPGNNYVLSWNVNSDIIDGTVVVFSGATTGNTVLKTCNASDKIAQFTIPVGHTKLAFRLGVEYTGNTLVYNDIMLNLGAALPYEPYNEVDWYPNTGHGYSSGAWD